MAYFFTNNEQMTSISFLALDWLTSIQMTIHIRMTFILYFIIICILDMNIFGAMVINTENLQHYQQGR